MIKPPRHFFLVHISTSLWFMDGPWLEWLNWCCQSQGWKTTIFPIWSPNYGSAYQEKSCVANLLNPLLWQHNGTKFFIKTDLITFLKNYGTVLKVHVFLEATKIDEIFTVDLILCSKKIYNLAQKSIIKAIRRMSPSWCENIV